MSESLLGRGFLDARNGGSVRASTMDGNYTK
jgi:hypothetical protein